MSSLAWRHRALVAELAKREFSGRYRGSFGGLAWSFAQPLFLLAVYTVAFGVILRMRWGFAGGTADYALMLFAGLIVFNAFAECLNNAPALVAGNPNYVKKIVFPLEVLPWVTALAAMVHAAIGIGVWFAGYFLLIGAPGPASLLFPAVLLALFPVLLGVGWLVSAIGVVVRDVGQFVGLVTHALLFLTPIFYGIDAVPPLLQRVLVLNPLTFVVEQLRVVLFFGQVPSLRGLAVYFALACAFAALSLALFRRMRPRFADLV
ncbi:MAG TPA: ABC transporter permease [Usitatibacter sp.]|nr:ABC transporter permease [Usitatibacter sp.]